MIAFVAARFLRHVILVAAGGAMFLATVLAFMGLRSALPGRRRFGLALTITFVGVAVSLYPIAKLLLGVPVVRLSEEAWEYAAGVVLIFIGLAIAVWDLKYPYWDLSRRGGKVKQLVQWIVEKWRTRPAEFRQSALGVTLGAARVLQGWAQSGFSVDGFTPEVQGAVVILVTQYAWIKTWLVAKKQRDTQTPVSSAPDGSVLNL